MHGYDPNYGPPPPPHEIYPGHPPPPPPHPDMPGMMPSMIPFSSHDNGPSYHDQGLSNLGDGGPPGDEYSSGFGVSPDCGGQTIEGKV